MPDSYFKPSIFQVAAFDLFYSSLPLELTRAVVGVTLSVIALIPLTTNAPEPPYLVVSILLIFIMFEAFYRFKLSRFRQVTKRHRSDDWKKQISLSLAKLLLQSPQWDSTSSLFSKLVWNHTVSVILVRADFSSEKIGQLIAALKEEKINLDETMKLANTYSVREGKGEISPVELLLALFEKSPLLGKALFDAQLKTADLANIAFWVSGEDRKPFYERSVQTLGNGIGEAWSGGWTAQTESYTQDLSKAIIKGRLDTFLIGRQKETAQVEEVLARSSKRNIILLGEAGIGKASLVYNLAARSLAGDLPEALKYKRFLELDLTALLAQASGGELEARLKSIFEELTHASNVVLYIPQIENLVGAVQGFDISGLLSGVLGEGRLQVIGTSNRSSHRTYVEQKPAFSETFEIMDLPPTTEEETVRILEGRAPQLEKAHHVTITFKALAKTVELSDRFLVDRVQPGKSIDLLDEVAAAMTLQKKKVVEASDVEQILTEKTKVPVSLASGNEADKLLKLEETLHRRIVSQNEAINSISESIRRARTIVRETKRPIGVFLFLGPTGVGKTETAKALAEVYFGDERKIIRLDMSEFQEEEAINRLIGPPPGKAGFESGGQLTEAVRADPFSLILLDEIEKAHPKIQEAFLAIFDEGRLTDAGGRLVSFSNSIIIATSNAGAEFIRESILEGQAVEVIKKALLEKLQREGTFKPEFLNRFDDIVVYKPLEEGDVSKVVELMLVELKDRLGKQDIEIELTAEATSYLAQKGYDPTYGARSLRRVVADEVEGLVSKKILSQEVSRGSKIVITLKGGTLAIA